MMLPDRPIAMTGIPQNRNTTTPVAALRPHTSGPYGALAMATNAKHDLEYIQDISLRKLMVVQASDADLRRSVLLANLYRSTSQLQQELASPVLPAFRRVDESMFEAPSFASSLVVPDDGSDDDADEMVWLDRTLDELDDDDYCDDILETSLDEDELLELDTFEQSLRHCDQVEIAPTSRSPVADDADLAQRRSSLPFVERAPLYHDAASDHKSGGRKSTPPALSPPFVLYAQPPGPSHFGHARQDRGLRHGSHCQADETLVTPDLFAPFAFPSYLG